MNDDGTLQINEVIQRNNGILFVVKLPRWGFDGKNFRFNDSEELVCYTFDEAIKVGIVEHLNPPTQQELPMATNLIEITLGGQTLVVPAGTSVEAAMEMVKDAENVGTRDVPLEEIEYLNSLYDIAGNLNLGVLVAPQSTPPISVVAHGTPESVEVFVCNNTVELHKWLRKESAKKDDDGEK